ncbi:helix-turn-helix transcriptional regulator [Paenibacillus sp.]|uniref:AraC family transcriptional regulator n=1 Tax=Paenibacillus sp. TaxID=58172 RepID=UPI0028115D9D|nr:helix-turn-helix transcriptional regulator [Paenibacillus sp.]
MLASFQYVFWRGKRQFLLEADTNAAWVLFAVEDGAFRFRVGSAEGVAEAGDVVACPPGTLFHRHALSPVTFHFLRLELEDPSPAYLSEGKVRVANRSRLASDLVLLRRFAEDPSPEAERLKRHLLEDMLAFGFHDAGRASDMPAEDATMSNAAALIRDRAGEKAFGIRQAAEAAGLTPVQFSRKFQAAFRTTPVRYLTECRIKLAKELLADTNLTLEEIAPRCGYENAFYMSRVFKQVVSTSPSAYRKACQV